MKICVLALLLFAATATATAAQQAALESAQPHSFEINGNVVNAINGEPMARTRVTLATAFSSTPQQPAARFQAQRGPGRGPARGAPPREPAETSPAVRETRTDQNGFFRFTDVLPGKYALAAQRKGYPRQLLEEHEGYSTSVVVGAGKNSRGIIFGISPECGISGRITDEYGDPVHTGRVMLFMRSTSTGEQAVHLRTGTSTDSQGNYHFSHLSPGTYYVVVMAQPWFLQYARMTRQQGSVQAPEEGDANLDVAFPVTFYPGALDQNDASPIQLRLGDRAVADMVLTTLPAMHLRVNNIDPQAAVQPLFTMSIFGQEAGVGAQMTSRMTSSADGGDSGRQFEVDGLAPGHYNVTMHNFRPESGPQQGRRQSIDATSDFDLDVNKGAEAAPVTATLEVEGGGKLPRGAVQFRKVGTDDASSSRTSPEGEFENFHLYPGRYAVTAAYPPYILTRLSATGAKVRGRTLEITDATPVQLQLKFVRQSGTVEGVVHATDSQTPMSGAMVVLVPEDVINDAPLFRRFQSDSDGSFQFDSVVPGKYTVIALRNGWSLEWGKPEILRAYLSQGDAINVEPGAKLKANVAAQ